MSGGGALGALNISLLLETIQFRSEMSKAAYLVNRDVGKMAADFNSAGEKIGGILKGIAAGLGTALTVEAFTGMVSGAIKAQEELGLLAEKAGMTASRFSSLTTAASLSNTGFGEVASMSAKMSKALVDAQIDTSKQASVLKALGLTAQQTKAMLANPAEGLFILSKALDEFEDDGHKNAATMLLLGKSAQEISPFFKALAEQQQLVATRTDAQIKAAREYQDKLTLLEIRSADLKTEFANGLLPVMTDVVDMFTKMGNGANSAKSLIAGLIADGSIKSWAQDAAIAVAVLAESLLFIGKNARLVGNDLQLLITDAAIAKGGLSALYATAKDPGLNDSAANEAINQLRALFAKRKALIAAEGPLEAAIWENNTQFSDALKKQFASSAAKDYFDRRDAESGGAVPGVKKKPSVNIALDNPGAQAALRKELDGQVKIIEQYIKQEEQLVSSNESLMSRLYGEGLVGIETYFNDLNGARDEELTRVKSFYDQIIALYDRAAKVAKTQADGVDFQEKALLFAERKKEFVAAVMLKERDAYYDNVKAARDYADAVIDSAARVAAIQGKAGDFAGKQFDAQNRFAYRAAVSNNDPEQVARLNTLRLVEEGERRIGDVERANALQRSLLSTAQGTIDVQQQTMAIGEIEALTRKSALAAQYVTILQAQADKQEAIARTLPGMVGAEAMAKVAEFRLQIQQLAAQTDLLGDKLQHAFRDDFVSALDSVLDRTKSLKDGIKDLGKSLSHELNHLASQQIADSIFGKGGPAGGLGGLISSLFGGKPGEGAGAGGIGGFLSSLFGGKAADAAGSTGVAALSAAATTSAPALAALTASASAAASALAMVAASSAGSAAAGLAGKFATGFGGFSSSTSSDWTSAGGMDLPTFASGIDYVPHDMIAKIHAGERVVTAEDNHADRSGRGGTRRVINQTNNFNYDAPPDNRSRGQVAADAYMGASRASRVN